MPRPPTRFSRVSVGFHSSTVTLPDYDAADTGDVFSVTGGSAFGELSATTLTATTSLGVGGGTTLTGISVTSVTVDFGSLGVSGGQSTLTVGVTGATEGDGLFVSLPSIWSVADYQVNVAASSGDTTGEVNLTALNSGLSAVNPTAGAFQILRIGV